MGIIGGNSLQPARENHHFYIRKIKNSKVHKLTGSLKRIKILGRRKSEKRFKSIRCPIFSFVKLIWGILV